MITPLTAFCDEVAYICATAALLSRPELADPSVTRDDIYLDACLVLNALRDNGAIDDGFFDYLCMHLNYAFANGGIGGLQ